MARKSDLPLIHGISILAGVLIAGGLIFLIGVIILLIPPPEPIMSDQPVLLTIIPAPTATRIIPTIMISPTPAVVGGISVGVFVQIEGTGGVGLRLRSGPGTTFTPRLLGMDAEVFQVKDGPQDVDGFTWWYLEAPYDKNRSGWAASKYLKVVKPEN